LGPTQKATLYVGQNKGHNTKNRTKACAKAADRFSIREIDRAFLRLRAKQVGKEATGGTRTKGRGWYEGKPEDAAAYEVIFIPSDKEESYRKFRSNLSALADKMSKKFCQDSVIIVHDNGDKTKSYDAAWYKKRDKKKK